MTDVSKSFDGFWTRLQLYGRSNIPFEYLKGYKPELEDTQEFAIKYSRGGDTYQFVQLRDKDKHKAGVELADIDVGPKFDEHTVFTAPCTSTALWTCRSLRSSKSFIVVANCLSAS